MKDPSQRARIVVGVSLGTGVPGLISLTREHALEVRFGDATHAEEMTGFRSVSLTTPIAYGCLMRSKAKRGLEYGLCAPYLSYGRGHPIYGDRLAAFIPFVGSLTFTGSGAIGASYSLPLFTPLVRLGFTFYVEQQNLAPFSTALLQFADRAYRLFVRVAKLIGSKAR